MKRVFAFAMYLPSEDRDLNKVKYTQSTLRTGRPPERLHICPKQLSLVWA